MKHWETAGLFIAWAIHDAEEWFTVGRWSRARGSDPQAPGWLKRLPWMNHGISDRQMHAAIAAMGIIVASAALDGLRTSGRSTYYRSTVLGYGLHGVGHLAATAALRGYTPGVATTPVTVVPYAAWALRRSTQEHGPIRAREIVAMLALLPTSLAIAHNVGNRVDRQDRSRAPR
ncbi:MAG: HXXEE domain-containing protein [Rhodococcus sp.]|nr:HXXEE domain-containing protein [Rhodococcus sp. (in: high G+C Gram-positive bacteria)]